MYVSVLFSYVHKHIVHSRGGQISPFPVAFSAKFLRNQKDNY